MATREYIRIGLLLANGLVYGGIAWLYLRTPRNTSTRPCPLCGAHADPLCVGVRKTVLPITTETSPRASVAA